MIQKALITVNGYTVTRVTFTLPDSLWAEKVYLVGDFNDWQYTATPLTRTHSGEWRVTVDLESGRTYQFRYLCDNTRWLNDSNADGYMANPYGDDNFLVVAEPAIQQDHDEPDRNHF